MVTKRKGNPRDNPRQSAIFIETAKKLGSDETGGMFNRAFASATAPRRKKKLAR